MKRFDAVIFDMDGTLIEQMLDFRAIRLELGIDGQMGILESIAQMPPERASLARECLAAHELAAAQKAAPLPGAMEILAEIGRAGLKSALLTRNTRRAMEIVLELFRAKSPSAGDVFDLAWSREDGPIKPEPDGIWRACEQLGAAPGRTCCVGDFHYDITAANAAGAVSVLLLRGENRSFADKADYAIERLEQLTDILEL